MGFWFADENLIFSTALCLMLIIAVFEGVLVLVGFGLSSMLDGLLPDFEVSIDASDLDGEGGGLFQFLGWLNFGKVPALVLLIVLLTAFGLAGIGLQQLCFTLLGRYAPGWLMVVPAFAVALPVVRWSGLALSWVMIRDETEAVSSDDFIGMVATITVGVAEKGSPAEAKLKDRFGTTHYVMVEPDSAGQSFSQNDRVLIVEKTTGVFRVVEPENSNLL